MPQSPRPGRGDFGPVRGPDDRHARDQAQRGDLLDRLVSGAVLPHKDAVVCKDIDHLDAHDVRQTDRRAHIVRKHQEGGSKGDKAAVERQAVQDAAHGVLAHAKVKVLALEAVPADVSAALDQVEVEGARSAEPPTNIGSNSANFWITSPLRRRVAFDLAGSAASNCSSRSSGKRAGDGPIVLGGQVGVRRAPGA